VKLLALMTFGLTAVVQACVFTGVAAENPRAAVDKVIIRNVDITGDGKPDTITLRVTGKDMFSPLKWTLTISSLGETVLSHTSDDKDKHIDGFFRDEGYVGECKGYLECKSKWYFKDLLSILIVPKTGYHLGGIMPGIEEVAGQYLAKRFGVRGEKAKAIISDIKTRLGKGQAIMISIPDTPAISDPIMVFSPQVRRFVEIYQD
jgi:hypothetical protein